MIAGTSEIHLRQITNLLRRRWKLIGAFALIGGALAGAAGYHLPARYTAKAQLLYEAEVRNGVEVIDEAAIDTLVELLVSPSHLRRLEASLVETPIVLPEPAAGAAGPAPTDGSEPAPAPALDLEALTKHLSAYKERKSRLIAVAFSSTDPVVSAEVANRAVDLYLSLETERQAGTRSRRLMAVAERLPLAQAELDRAEQALRTHRIAHGLVGDGSATLAEQQIAELTRQGMIARSELAARDDRIAALQPADEAVVPEAPLPGDQSHLLVGAPEEVLGAPGAGTAESERILAQLLEDRTAVAARLREVEERLTTLQQASTAAGEAEVRARELEREASAAGQVFETLLRRQADLLTESSPGLPFRLISVATPPDRPTSPSPLLFVLPAIIAAGIAGGLLAILFERLDQRLRSERDVEEALGVPCIGLVPRIASGEATALRRTLRDAPFAPYTEAIRSVFAAATRHAPADGFAQSFLFTSSAQREGSSTLALSFAAYARRLHHRVLLIDLDFRTPGLARLLGEEAGGSGRPVAGQASTFVIHRATGFDIDYITVPREDLDPLAVLESQEFPELLARSRKEYDFIVIDGAPLGQATETRLIAAMVNRVILAVQWGATEARDAWGALQLLRASGGDGVPVSVVITKVNVRAHRRYRYGEPGALAHAQAHPT